MPNVIINHLGNVEEVSDTSFFERVFGHAPRTKEQREAEWQANVERYAEMILRGSEYAVPPAYLWDARKLIALREGDAGVCGDPLRRVA